LDPPPGGITRRVLETADDPADVEVDVDLDVAAVVPDERVGVVGDAELPELVDGEVAVEVADCGVAVRATAEDAVVLVAMAVGGAEEQPPKLTPTSARAATTRRPRNLGYRFMNYLLFAAVAVTG